MILAPDTILNHYRIGHKLGSGGMADVYQATDERMGRQVAIKILPPEFARDEGNVTRFKKEIMAAAALDHANIVKVYDVGEAQWQGFTLNYYTMDLLPGGDLKQRITEGLSANEALRILRQVAEALGHAHERGFVHRDIKPENILFDARGNAVLTDLGIAKAIGSGTKMTKTGMSIGTPHYMSPEQARGLPLDGRSDLYSLGVVFYEMQTGQLPFNAEDTLAVAFAHVHDPVPELPFDLANYQPLVARLLAKDASDRYQDGNALVRDIDTLLAGEVLSQVKPGRQNNAVHIDRSVSGNASHLGVQVVAGKIGFGGYGLKWAVGGGAAALVLVLALSQIDLLESGGSSPALSSGGIDTTQPRQTGASSLNTVMPAEDLQNSPVEPLLRQGIARWPNDMISDEESSQDEKIEGLITGIYEDIRADRLSSPQGNNALEKYSELVSIGEENEKVTEVSNYLIEIYEQIILAAVGNESFNEARQYLSEIEESFSPTPQIHETLTTYLERAESASLQREQSLASIEVIERRERDIQIEINERIDMLLEDVDNRILRGDFGGAYRIISSLESMSGNSEKQEEIENRRQRVMSILGVTQ